MLLSNLLPWGAAVEELHQFPNPSVLLPEELEITARFSPNRLLAFAAGRLCARMALRRFSISDTPILIGKTREPIWPSGFIGSITHTLGYCAAAVARREDIVSIGIDAEIVGRVGLDIWPIIFRPDEIEWLNALPDETRDLMATLLFSGKEAFFKCQFPLTGVWLEFCDVKLVVETPTTFVVTEKTNVVRPLYRYRGKYGFSKNNRLVMSSVVASLRSKIVVDSARSVDSIQAGVDCNGGIPPLCNALFNTMKNNLVVSVP